MKTALKLCVLGFLLMPCLAWGQDEALKQHLFENLNWSEDVALEPISETTLGQLTHKRYQQHYKGLPVLGGQWISHQSLTGELSSSEQLWPEPNREWSSRMSENEMLELARQKYPDHQWSPNQTFERVWADPIYPKKSGKLVPAWNVIMHAHTPHARIRFLIEAETGRIILNHSLNCAIHDNHGFQSTLYHGIQEIPLSFNRDTGLYFLGANGGLAPIRTFRSDGEDWWDSDGVYVESDTAYLSGAIDAHWAIHQTRDFFYERFGRDGITGTGDTIKSYVFPVSFPYNNAFWDGEAMYYGAGDTVEYGPFTSIDICAHEYMHGITEFTSGLEYTYESGALNESMSDIFGKILERYKSPSNFSWILGERIILDFSRLGIRDMSDPHNLGDPKYYKGQFWWTNRFDNGGVHINSGVLNYWFYLMVDGGSGKAEGGEEYSVQGLGWDDATELVYLLLTQYLTPTSQYTDARNESMKIARTLFADDAWKLESVAEAWYAVGLGHPIRDRDLSLTAYDFQSIICDTLSLQPAVDIINQSLGDTVPEGTELILSYSYRSRPEFLDTVRLNQAMLPGDIYSHAFSGSIKENQVLKTEITFELQSEWDTFEQNNRAKAEVERLGGLDFEVAVFESRDSRPQCERGDSLRVFFAGEYNGCTPISSSDSFMMRVDLYGQIIERWIHPLRTVYPGAFVFFGEFDFVDIPFGFHPAVISFSHLNDPVKYNDTLRMNFYRIKTTAQSVIADFTQGSQFDSTALVLDRAQFHRIQLQEEGGEPSLVIGSNGIFNSIGQLAIDTFSKRLGSFMLVNQNHTTNIRICVETEKFLEPKLEFEVMRQSSPWGQSSLGTRQNLSCAIAVGFPGYIEYLNDMPYDEFVSYSYDLPKSEEPLDIRLQNLVLWSDIDSVSGNVSDKMDRIVYRNVRVTDSGVSNELLSERDFEVYPNPNPGSFRLDIPKRYGIGVIRVFNSAGTLIVSKSNRSSTIVELNLPTPGLYYALFENEDGIRLGSKIVVKR